MTWDDEQVARLRALAAHPDELSSAQIAALMGFATRNPVIGACYRYGIKLQRKTCSRRPKKKPSLAFNAPAFKAEPFKARDVKCEPLHLTLNAKSSSQCSFPYGDGPFTFCGHPVVEGYSYCEAHKELCLVKPVKPAKAKPFIPTRGRAA